MKVINSKDALHVRRQAPALKIALLCDYSSDTAGTILDHIFGIRDISYHDVTVVNFRGELPQSVDLDQFDGLIVHYSLVACYDSYVSPLTRIKIRNYQGVKIAFVQDDYRFIDDTVAALTAMRINALLSVVGEDVINDVYPAENLPGVRRETVLTGYVSEHLLDVEVPKYEDRPIDVGYRARKLPVWLGSHGQEKWVVADKFIKSAGRYGLKCDISWKEGDRIYGDKWLEFVSSSKAMIGVESGSSVCDFTGEIQKDVEAHVARDPEATFEELRDLYFKEEDGRLVINVISPRCFEAAALRTLMIMYDGYYSGRLVAGRHYVVLDRDHGNMDEVVSILRDSKKALEIIDNAYNEVALNPDNTFRSMVKFLDEVIDERYTTVCGNKRQKQQGRKSLYRSINSPNRKGIDEVGWKRLIWKSTGYCFRKYTEISAKIFYLVGQSGPYLATIIFWMLKLLPRPLSVKIYSRVQEEFRHFIARKTSLIKSSPFQEAFRMLLFPRARWNFVNIFGYTLARNHLFRLLGLVLAVHRIVGMVRIVEMADDVKVAVAYNPVSEVLVLRAHYHGSPLEWGELSPTNLEKIVQDVDQGAITLKSIIWNPIGLHGLSKALPFSGTQEFNELAWGMETCPGKVVRFLQAEMQY